MSQELESKHQHLEALKAFLMSPAYIGYLAAIDVEIEASKNTIVTIPPTTPENTAELLMEHGELRCLEADKTRFEDARVSLEKLIDEMAEQEMQNATETKK